MTNDEAITLLLRHLDPKIQEAGLLWSQHLDWCIEKFKGLDTTLKNATEVMEQSLLDTKYLVFDLEATRRERDKLRKKQ
jgi:hypothetical protein